MSDVSDINTLLKKWGVFMSKRDIIRKCIAVVVAIAISRRRIYQSKQKSGNQ